MKHEFLEDIVIWEESERQRAIDRRYKTKKDFKDPRVEKYRDYRRRNRGYKYHYDSECKGARKIAKHKFRRKFKRELYAEHFYNLTPHDFKTYGWLTW